MVPVMRAGPKADIEVVEVDETDWVPIARTFADYNFEQVVEYSNAMARRSHASPLLFVIRQNQPIGAASIRLKRVPLTGRGIAYIASGPMTRRGDMVNLDQLKAVLAALKSKLVDELQNVLRIRLPATPPLPKSQVEGVLRDLGFRPTAHGNKYTTFAVDLLANKDKLLRNLNGKWRNHLHQSMKACLDLQTGSTNEMSTRFLRLFQDVRSAKGFKNTIDPDFFFALGKNELKLEILIAQRGGDDVAGQVLAFTGNAAVYLFGATNEIGRQYQAGYLLNWSSLLLAKERGCRWYDLGGVDEKTNASGYEFKSRMGGQYIEAIGPYEARPGGLLDSMIEQVESLRARFMPA